MTSSRADFLGALKARSQEKERRRDCPRGPLCDPGALLLVLIDTPAGHRASQCALRERGRCFSTSYSQIEARKQGR